MNKALLPAGFHDLLFPEAGYQAYIISRLSACFEENGYGTVNPPAIEFDDSLFYGAGKALENETFRLMDPLSHKMMGLRADMTVQVARIATTRLKSEPLPVRLSYNGDVYRVKGEGLHAERQLTQAGIELIGADSATADAEVVIIILEALKNIGIADICVDFTIPGLVDIVLESLEIPDGEKENLISAIKKKDTSFIEKLGGKKAEVLLSLIDTDITMDKLSKIKLPKAAVALRDRLNDVVTILKNTISDVAISISPMEVMLPNYHKTIGFSIFSKNSKDEIGRGGRYITGEDTCGVGATLYVNELFRILPKPVKKEKILVPFSTTSDRIRQLQNDGLVVIRSLEKYKDTKSEAQRLKCEYIFENDKKIAI